MPNIRIKRRPLHLKAFTVLEALVTVALTSFLILHLSAGVRSTLKQTEESLFFIGFERVYQDSQQLAIASRQPVFLELTQDKIRNPLQEIEIPATVSLTEPLTIRFDPDGGNSSLAKVSFQTEEKLVHYQLYLGSGRYKKSIR